MTDNPQRRSIAPVVTGIFFTVALLAFIGYAASKRRAAEADTVPQITVLTPSSGAVVDSPLVVRFVTSHPISLQSGGWGYGRFHLHAWIDGVAHMPAAADIQPAGDSLYEWTFTSYTPTGGQLSLGWADQAHREWPSGSSAPIQIRIK
jgi:hypothetical protein